MKLFYFLFIVWKGTQIWSGILKRTTTVLQNAEIRLPTMNDLKNCAKNHGGGEVSGEIVRPVDDTDENDENELKSANRNVNVGKKKQKRKVKKKISNDNSKIKEEL